MKDFQVSNNIPLIENISLYEKHIFFCSNMRTNGKKSCGQFNAEKLTQYAKILIQPQNIDKKIRVSSSGCLGKCEHGPVMVVYPDNLWFTYNSEKQIEEIISTHIMNNPLSIKREKGEIDSLKCEH